MAPQSSKRQRHDKHVQFATDTMRHTTAIREFLFRDISKADDSDTEHIFPLVKLAMMPGFIYRAKASNVAKCRAASKFMPCCHITSEKADMTCMYFRNVQNNDVIKFNS